MWRQFITGNTDLMKSDKRFRMYPDYVETGSVAHEQLCKQTDEHSTDFFILQKLIHNSQNKFFQNIWKRFQTSHKSTYLVTSWSDSNLKKSEFQFLYLHFILTSFKYAITHFLVSSFKCYTVEIVWSGTTTITNCRQTRGIVGMSHTTIMRNLFSKATKKQTKQRS